MVGKMCTSVRSRLDRNTWERKRIPEFGAVAQRESVRFASERLRVRVPSAPRLSATGSCILYKGDSPIERRFSLWMTEIGCLHETLTVGEGFESLLVYSQDVGLYGRIGSKRTEVKFCATGPCPTPPGPEGSSGQQLLLCDAGMPRSIWGALDLCVVSCP